MNSKSEGTCDRCGQTAVFAMLAILLLPTAAHGQAWGESSCGKTGLGDIWGYSATYMPWGWYGLGVEAWILDPMWGAVDYDWYAQWGTSVSVDLLAYPLMTGWYRVQGDHYVCYWEPDWEFIDVSDCEVEVPEVSPPTGEDIVFSGWSTSGGLFADSYATLTPSSGSDYDGWTISDGLQYVSDTCYQNYPTRPRADPGAGMWTVMNGAYGPDPIGSSSEWLDVYAPMVASGTLQACGWTFLQDMYYDRGSGPEYFTSHNIGQSLEGTTATSRRGSAGASHPVQ